MTDAMLDHEWEAPSDFLLDNSSWSPGACVHRPTESDEMCGVRFLAFRHQGQERVAAHLEPESGRETGESE